MTLGVQTGGFNELIGELKQFGDKAGLSMLKKSLKAGAAVVQSAIVARAPERTGTLKKNIEVKPMPKKAIRRGSVGFRVTTTGGAEFAGEAFYASFVEFGHFIGKRDRVVRSVQKKRLKLKKAGLAVPDIADIVAGSDHGLTALFSGGRRWVPPQPFARPAFNASKNAAYAAIAAAMRGLIRKAQTQILNKAARITRTRTSAAQVGAIEKMLGITDAEAA